MKLKVIIMGIYQLIYLLSGWLWLIHFWKTIFINKT